MGFDTMLWLLALIAACSAGAFFAGWKSAQAYLPASKSVGEMAGAVVDRSNQFTATLDETRSSLASLEKALESATKVNDARYEAVEITLRELFEGLISAGVARSRPTGRQHGEGPAPGA